jgi:glutathione S-transferase
VRFVLAEKGIQRGPDVPWRSDAARHVTAPAGTYVGRPISLPRQVNLSEEYAAIHPNLVVPALVHDGVLHIESVDIMNYVDQELEGPSLVPGGEPGHRCRALVKRGSELQNAVRHVTYRWSLGGLAKLSPRKQAELQRIDSPDSPERLTEFYRRFSNGKISEDAFAGHVADLTDGFREVEALLADGRAWLCGETFSLADIIWAVKVHRIDEAGYPFATSFPLLAGWFDRVRDRPGFQEAIGRDLGVASRFMRLRGSVQNLLGRGLRRVTADAGV